MTFNLDETDYILLIATTSRLTSSKEFVDDALSYNSTFSALRKWGTVLTEDVGQQHSPETDASISDKWIHDRDVEWLHEADVVVAEVTQPSLGVGYEIGKPLVEKGLLAASLGEQDSQRTPFTF